MKVIFLDIDGVVTSSRDNGFRDFNLHVVHWLRWVCEVAPAQIVISSTWRHSFSREFWQTVFGEYVHEDWRTPNGSRRQESGLWLSCKRGDEIAQWLEHHPEIEDYAILDDDLDMRPEQKAKFIATDPHNGALFEHLMALRDNFGIDTFPKADAEIYQHPNMFGRTREREVFKSAVQPKFI